MIKVENLKRTYGDFVAVHDVSFEIPKGEIVGLLGHNGAGKSTILKMLTGYLEPSIGRVLIDGSDICDDRLKVQDRIGYLPENSPLYPEMTVMHYLEYVSELRSIQPDKKMSAIKIALERTKLMDRAFQVVGTLSKGYKQRLGVAQAIINNPDILILDEPTNGLDPSQIHEMRDLIKSLSENSTIILSTHILQEVEAICDRVIIILNGNIAVDAYLSDLQDARSLLLTTNQSSEVVSSGLKAIEGIGGVRCVSNGNGHGSYAIQVNGNLDLVAPLVARTVVEKGWNLYKLEPDRRNLEAVFREINSGATGGKNV